MNVRGKRSERKTIRIRPDILEVAEQICDTNNYSLADIFEMGVLLLDDSNNANLVLQSKFYEDILERFTHLEEKVSSDCKKIQERIINEINLINESKEHNRNVLKSKKINGEKFTNIDKAVSEVVSMIKKRQETRKILEPLGTSYYEFVSNKYSIPVDVLVNGVYDEGYDSETLIDLGMNPNVRWKGYAVSKKGETFD